MTGIAIEPGLNARTDVLLCSDPGLRDRQRLQRQRHAGQRAQRPLRDAGWASAHQDQPLRRSPRRALPRRLPLVLLCGISCLAAPCSWATDPGSGRIVLDRTRLHECREGGRQLLPHVAAPLCGKRRAGASAERAAVRCRRHLQRRAHSAEDSIQADQHHREAAVHGEQVRGGHQPQVPCAARRSLGRSTCLAHVLVYMIGDR